MVCIFRSYYGNRRNIHTPYKLEGEVIPGFTLKVSGHTNRCTVSYDAHEGNQEEMLL